jgi:hypothetical protein
MANSPIRIAILYFLNGFSGGLFVTPIANRIVPIIKIRGVNIQNRFFMIELLLGKSTCLLLIKNSQVKRIKQMLLAQVFVWRAMAESR